MVYDVKEYFQKQPPEVHCKKRCSEKFRIKKLWICELSLKLKHWIENFELKNSLDVNNKTLANFKSEIKSDFQKLTDK